VITTFPLVPKLRTSLVPKLRLGTPFQETLFPVVRLSARSHVWQLAKQSFGGVRSQTEFGNESREYPASPIPQPLHCGDDDLRCLVDLGGGREAAQSEPQTGEAQRFSDTHRPQHVTRFRVGGRTG